MHRDDTRNGDIAAEVQRIVVVIEMGNTYLEPKTKANLLEYMDKNDHRTPSRAVDALLAEHDLLLVTQRERDLLRQINLRGSGQGP